MELGARVIISIGSLNITETLLFAWIVCAILIIFALISTRNMQRVPKGSQAVAELIVEKIYNLVASTMGKENLTFAPYIGSLMMFLVLSNVLGLLMQRPVTADTNVTFALAGITFVLIHYNAVRTRTLKGYVKHLSEPYPFMLPINLIGELAFPVSLSFRLFGNITGGFIIMELLYHGLSSLSAKAHLPIPLFDLLIPLPAHFFFDMFEAGLQAFIFTMLTMVFIANGMASHENHYE